MVHVYTYTYVNRENKHRLMKILKPLKTKLEFMKPLILSVIIQIAFLLTKMLRYNSGKLLIRIIIYDSMLKYE